MYVDECADADPYEEWKGGTWIPGTRSFNITPRWQQPIAYHSYGPLSGEGTPHQMDLNTYQAPIAPHRAGVSARLSQVNRAAAQPDYTGQFQSASAPAIPSSGATLAGIGVY